MLFNRPRLRADDTAPPAKPAVKPRRLRPVRLLGRDASELPEADLAEYIRLLRIGDPQSLAAASMIFPGARKDAAALRDLQKLLQEKPNLAEANGKKEWFESELAALDDQILELRAKRNLLQRDLNAVENMVGDYKSWQFHVAHLAGSEPIARKALADELSAAGF